MIIAFDTDDTLIIPAIVGDNWEITPHYKNISIFNWFASQWCYMIVWSWTWPEWAEKWAKELNLPYNEIRVKQKYDDIDICFDDCNVDLAKVNVKVKRVKNSVKRNRDSIY